MRRGSHPVRGRDREPRLELAAERRHEVADEGAAGVERGRRRRHVRRRRARQSRWRREAAGSRVVPGRDPRQPSDGARRHGGGGAEGRGGEAANVVGTAAQVAAAERAVARRNRRRGVGGGSAGRHRPSRESRTGAAEVRQSSSSSRDGQRVGLLLRRGRVQR